MGTTKGAINSPGRNPGMTQSPKNREIGGASHGEAGINRSSSGAPPNRMSPGGSRGAPRTAPKPK